MGMLNFVILGRYGDGEIFSEPGGVIISYGLAISECFQYRVTYLYCSLYLLLRLKRKRAEVACLEMLVIVVNEPQTLLIGLCFARSRLARNNDRLGLSCLQKILQYLGRDRVNVRLVLY